MDDFDRFVKERNAAAHLRDGLFNLVGQLKGEEDVAAIHVNNQLEALLEGHQILEQDFYLTTNGKIYSRTIGRTTSKKKRTFFV